jgi:hypothetical protein
MIEFKLPFENINSLELQDMICNKPFPPLTQKYSLELKNTINGMLIKV